MIVSWENPTPHWAVYPQIVMKMIFIRTMMLSCVNDLIEHSKSAYKIQVVRTVKMIREMV